MSFPAPHLQTHPTPLAIAHPAFFVWVMCRPCGCIFHLGIRMPAPIPQVVEAIQAGTCPECSSGAGAHIIPPTPTFMRALRTHQAGITISAPEKNRHDARFSA